MELSRCSRFKRSFKKLPADIQDDFDDPLLKTHKLHGNLAVYYAFYLKDGYRVLFVFEGDNTILLVNIGDHDQYKKWSR